MEVVYWSEEEEILVTNVTPAKNGWVEAKEFESERLWVLQLAELKGPLNAMEIIAWASR